MTDATFTAIQGSRQSLSLLEQYMLNNDQADSETVIAAVLDTLGTLQTAIEDAPDGNVSLL